MGSIKKNYVYQSLYQLLIIILPLITAPYISRILGAENVGIYSYTYIIANYFVVFANLGIESYGNRCIACTRENEDEKNRVFSEIFELHVIISVIVIIVYLGLTFFVRGKFKIFLAIQGLFVASSLFDVNWFFFGIEKFKITVTRNMIIKICTVLLIFITVKTKNDLWKYSLIMSGGTLVSQVALWSFIPKYVKFRKTNFKDCIKHVKPLLILFIAVIATNMYRMIDKFMLGWRGDLTALGCYEYADKFIRIPLGFITAYGTVMLSRMSNIFTKKVGKKANEILSMSGTFVILLSFAMAFGLAAISPDFIIIFLGGEYEQTVGLLIILSITIPLIGWNNYVRTQILIPTNNDKTYTMAVTIGAMVNFFLNLIFINFWGAEGAAIATIFSYSTVSIIQTPIAVKFVANTKFGKDILFSVIAGTLMLIVVRIIGYYAGARISSIVFEVVAGVIIYSLMTATYVYVFYKKYFYEFVKYTRRRIK